MSYDHCESYEQAFRELVDDCNYHEARALGAEADADLARVTAERDDAERQREALLEGVRELRDKHAETSSYMKGNGGHLVAMTHDAIVIEANAILARVEGEQHG